ncbi:acetyltransferase component of pyruvate dehydrogenase complex [Lachnospiraceae bacterium]|nr:acetyltransferase component of pyruvate dehydrogenase complex [Lachnospiraceae bacterium]BDF39311.1 acetyltransferase component of pyruvate dehydrogenase complex [Lachnospiraceae bacterium]
MIKEITMPAGGQTTDMSTIGAWLVKTGDKVKRGDELLTVETDKATLSVESFAKGTVLAILAEEGDQAAAGEVIALIGEESDRPQVEERLGGQSKAGLETAVAAAHAPSGKEEEEYQPIDKSVKAMPNAKLLAGEHGFSLRDVAASLGKDNLKRADVQKYIDEAPCMDTAGTEETGCGKASVTEVPLTSMRRTIARRMLESSRNVPVFRASVEVDMEPCIAFRTKVNGSKTGLKLSYNDILFKCIDAAVRKYPYVNASYTDDAILLHKNVNIGLAVSLEGGLVVPVVETVNEKTITEIAEANKSNISLAREGKLAPEDMSGGTITLSNLGMYPVVRFDAIINPPEACILAAGTVHDKPVLKDGRWVAVPVMTLTGSFDHRVVDGAYGASFLTELKAVIEDPAMALL